jgi:hypothetical protein
MIALERLDRGFGGGTKVLVWGKRVTFQIRIAKLAELGLQFRYSLATAALFQHGAAPVSL